MTTRTLRRSVGLSALLLSLVVLWLIADTATAAASSRTHSPARASHLCTSARRAHRTGMLVRELRQTRAACIAMRRAIAAAQEARDGRLAENAAAQRAARSTADNAVTAISGGAARAAANAYAPYRDSVQVAWLSYSSAAAVLGFDEHTAAACGQVDGITLVPAVLQPACAIYLDAILAATQTFNDISTTAWAQAEALINAILGSLSSQLSSLAARASSINQTYAAQVSGITATLWSRLDVIRTASRGRA